MDEILINSRWDCTVRNHAFRHVTVLFHVTEITEKVLLNHNTMYSPIVHRIHGYWYCLLSLLLFIMYMINVYWYTVLLLSLHHPSNLDNMDIDWLNNNINGQLTPGLGKLMEETASVFWVDLRTGYTVEIRFYCRIPRDDWHPILLLLLLL